VKKALSILLALFMLASNVGIAANTHYCGGNAVDRSLSLGFENLSCGMPESSEIIQSQEEIEVLRPQPCCEDVHELLQLDEEADVKKGSIEVNTTFFVAFVYACSTLHTFEEKEQPFQKYAPPLLRQNVQVLFQTFLI